MQPDIPDVALPTFHGARKPALEVVGNVRPERGQPFGNDRQGRPVLWPATSRTLAQILTERFEPRLWAAPDGRQVAISGHLHYASYRVRDPQTGEVLPVPRFSLRAMVALQTRGLAVEHIIAAVDIDLHQQPAVREELGIPRGSHSKVRWADFTAPQLERVRTAFDVAAQRLVAEGLAPTAFHTTEAGARFVHVLARPVPTDRWRAWYLGLCARYQAIGLVADEACCDPTRLFAAARVTKPAVPNPRTLEEHGGTRTWELPSHVVHVFGAAASVEAAA